MSNSYYCEELFTGRAWLHSARFALDADGLIHAVEADVTPGSEDVRLGVVVPGIPNLHSHAHQRAMAGLAERSGRGLDSFWTWRSLMYRHLQAMTPDDLEAIAAQLYLEMAEAGFTAVGEFQYLHHHSDGTPYDDVAEMTLRCRNAAREVGIGFAALPVYYAQGGFGGAAPGDGQRRFLSDRDGFHAILDSLKTQLSTDPAGLETLGLAPHSLRAATAEDLAFLEALEPDLPLHLHIAEQEKEVDDCVDWCGQRPVAWLYEHFNVDRRWCLIHATHLDDGEVASIAESGAVVGLCPVTEANLGDGLFRARDFLDAGGRFGIGSDSHISINPVEELRWLEYGQRLSDHGRNRLAAGPDASTARNLLEHCLEAGADALGQPAGELAPGRRGDWLVLDRDHPLLVARRGDEPLDSWIFSGHPSVIREVYVGGRRIVEGGRHPEREAIAERFRTTLERLRTKA
ncbi:MAG: formimidoylglutamate deiminase [Acidobacteriota bacterium]